MNNNLFLFFYNFSHQFLWLDNLIIFFAEYFPYLVVILAVCFFFREFLAHEGSLTSLMQKLFLIFCVPPITYIISIFLKNLFQVARPFLEFPNIIPLLQENGFSFPSSHTAFFSSLGFAIFFINKKAGYFFIFFALLIGFARIMAGVHFPVDILGGFVLGFLVSFLCSLWNRFPKV
ncbi:MAG: phosphatase PAP2 family protein [Patescibacteria group bacterium]